jgi:DNA-binding IclR family transcriptional regulator
LGLSALARLEPVTLAAPVLAQLREETQQTVALAVWANHGATMVRWLGADAPVAASLRLGSIMPLTRSATGRVFLAFLPRSMTAKWVKAELAENVRKDLQPKTTEQIDQIIRTTVRQGFAHTSDFIPGIAGAAAPVFDSSGALAMTLIALGYSKPFEAALERVSAAVLEKAGALSRRIGYKPQS